MKAILITMMLLVSSVTLATPPRGYNYKRHYKKCQRIKAMNRIFNLNGCKYHSQKV